MTDLRLANPNDRSKYYPRFSDDEYADRWERTRAIMREEGYDAVVIYGNSFHQSRYISYLTNYDTTYASYLVAFADPDEEPTLYVGISNHLQYVREVSIIDDLELMLHDPAKKVADRLKAGGAGDGTIGLVGTDSRYGHGMPYEHYNYLSANLSADLVNATIPFTHLTAAKSEEEFARLDRSASALDAVMQALEDEMEPGMTEHDVRDIIASTVAEEGCTVRVPFVSTAPMEDAQPGECLPWKDTPSDRTIESGDIVTTEISASYLGYSSQIHRAYTVDAPPTERYQDIFGVLEETYDRMVDALQPGNTAADLHEAMEPLEESEYKIYDVIAHGYGSSYMHPFLGTSDSNYWPGADDVVSEEWTFEPNQVIVVQPNLFTEDERYGFQLGTTVVVTEDGPEVIQEYPVALPQV
ncbi:MAG: M24 family metallopeptidase [Halobacteriota archaeon]